MAGQPEDIRVIDPSTPAALKVNGDGSINVVGSVSTDTTTIGRTFTLTDATPESTVFEHSGLGSLRLSYDSSVQPDTVFHSEDFEAMTLGAPPPGWEVVQLGDPTDPVASIEVRDQSGDRGLAPGEPTTVSRSVIAYPSNLVSEDNPIGDVDLFARVRSSSSFHAAQIFLRGSTAIDGEGDLTFFGYVIDVDGNGNEMVLYRLDGATSIADTLNRTVLATFDTSTRLPDGSPERWFQIRVQAQGDAIRAKIWRAPDTTYSEPVGWDIEVQDSTHTEGFYGYGVKGASNPSNDAVYQEVISTALSAPRKLFIEQREDGGEWATVPNMGISGGLETTAPFDESEGVRYAQLTGTEWRFRKNDFFGDFTVRATQSAAQFIDHGDRSALADLGTDLGNKLDTVDASINSKDFATETTLQSIDGKDFATEATLSGFVNDPGVYVEDKSSEAPVHVSHFGALKVASTRAIRAGNFPGTTLNRTLWVENHAGAGNIVVGSGVGKLKTGASTNSRGEIRSRHPGRFIAGQVTVFQSGVNPVTTGKAGVVKEWGLMDRAQQNGLCFRLDGTTFQVITMRDGVEVVTDAANFSHQPGYSISAQNRTWRIEYSAGRALFYDSVGGEKRLLHAAVDSDLPLVSNLILHGHFRCENDATNSTDEELRIRGFSISVWGEERETDLIYNYATPEDENIPSGAAITIDPVLNSEANVRDSGWIRRDEKKTQFFHISSDVDLNVYLMNASDENGNNIQGNLFPIPLTGGSTLTISAPFFDSYFRIVIENVSGSTTSRITAMSRHQEAAPGGVMQSIDAPIFGNYPAIVGQNVIKGYDSVSGGYPAVSVDSNGNLKVAPGARLSDGDGRTHVDANVDGVVTSTQIHPVTAGKRFQLTSLIISAENTSIVTNTNIRLRDGGVVGAVQIPFTLSEATNQTTSTLQQAISFPEPIPFTTDVFLELAGGTPNASVTVVGYEEPL